MPSPGRMHLNSPITSKKSKLPVAIVGQLEFITPFTSINCSRKSLPFKWLNLSATYNLHCISLDHPVYNYPGRKNFGGDCGPTLFFVLTNLPHFTFLSRPRQRPGDCALPIYLLVSSFSILNLYGLQPVLLFEVLHQSSLLAR